MLKSCEICTKEFDAKRSDARFCSSRCRYRANSRASKRQRIPNDLRFYVLHRDEFRCVYCGATPGEKELKVDHIVPIDAGGATMAPSNMATACGDCNDGKRAMVLEVYPDTLKKA